MSITYVSNFFIISKKDPSFKSVVLKIIQVKIYSLKKKNDFHAFLTFTLDEER